MELNELIISLCGESGPSGFEDDARDAVITQLKPFVDEIKTDVMGNIIAVKRCGKENARSIMLDAHMDEIGLIVTGHKDGYLRFSTIGGVDQRMLPAREVKVLTNPPIYGVIDVLPPHALSDDEMDKSLPVDKMYIDIGMSQEEAEKAVPLATPIVYDGGAQMLGENMICGKALDDRACAAIIIKAMEKRHIVYNEALEYVKQRERDGDVLVIRPAETLPIKRLEKDPETLKSVYEIGRAEGEKQIAKIKDFLGE